MLQGRLNTNITTHFTLQNCNKISNFMESHLYFAAYKSQVSCHLNLIKHSILLFHYYYQHARDDKEGKIAGSDTRNLQQLWGIHLTLDGSWRAGECHTGDLDYNAGLLAYGTFLSHCFNEGYGATVVFAQHNNKVEIAYT